MIDFSIKTCGLENTCYDCKETTCTKHGKKSADCPKWKCDREEGRWDCEHCDFIDGYIEDMRKEYAKSSGRYTTLRELNKEIGEKNENKRL